MEKKMYQWQIRQSNCFSCFDLNIAPMIVGYPWMAHFEVRLDESGRKAILCLCSQDLKIAPAEQALEPPCSSFYCCIFLFVFSATISLHLGLQEKEKKSGKLSIMQGFIFVSACNLAAILLWRRSSGLPIVFILVSRETGFRMMTKQQSSPPIWNSATWIEAKLLLGRWWSPLPLLLYPSSTMSTGPPPIDQHPSLLCSYPFSDLMSLTCRCPPRPHSCTPARMSPRISFWGHLSTFTDCPFPLSSTYVQKAEYGCKHGWMVLREFHCTSSKSAIV